MSDQLQVIVVTLVAFGALLVLVRPLLSWGRARGANARPSSSGGCDKCAVSSPGKADR